MENKVILPAKRYHKTPRLLMSDAYTIGSNKFESDEAKDKSVYYITFRRRLNDINPTLYSKEDQRIIFGGLQQINDILFYEPVTHDEIDNTAEFLKFAKVTKNGFENYEFPEEIWREVVNKYNGRPPILIEALPEGSVTYPNEPVVKATSLVKGWGVLSAWFESNLLKVWAVSERITQNEHLFKKLKLMVKSIEPNLSDDMVNLYASIMVTDFGDRAGITPQESEILGMAHLYTFGGTDTFAGAYQAWMNSNKAVGVFSSVNALAHRNVQSYLNENDCYTSIYNSCKNNEFMSMVADCYNFKRAVTEYQIPLALESQRLGNGKVVVSRPDSSTKDFTAKDQVLFICEEAVKNGLFEEKEINGVKWKFATTLHFIEGDGMSFDDVIEIIDALIERRFVPYSWGLFGMGGGLRNNLKRDNLSAKYALCSVGENDRGVVKFSENIGKTTLPGDFKLLRSTEALENKITVVDVSEGGDNAFIEYFNGARINKPFGIGQDDSFLTIKSRIRNQMDSMPLSLETQTNQNFPISDLIRNKRIEILNYYK